MSERTIRNIAFLLLLVHGIGHIQGVVCGFGVKFRERSTSTSWLLKSLGEGPNQVLCILFYLSTSVFALLAALAFKDVILQSASWQNLALVAAILSIFSLVLFPRALAMFFNLAGAIAVNLLIIAGQLRSYDIYGISE